MSKSQVFCGSCATVAALLLAAPARSLDVARIAVVEPISATMILPDSDPLPATGATVLTVIACRGEYEPASFVIRATTRPLSAVTVEAQDLKGQGGTIGRQNVDVKIVQVWYQAGGAWEDSKIDRNRLPTLVPELLVNDPTLVRLDRVARGNDVKLTLDGREIYVPMSQPARRDDADLPLTSAFPIRDAAALQAAAIPQGSNLQYWVTVHVPQQAVAGRYSGAIQIRDGSRSLDKLELTLEVLPFELAAPRLEYSLYYRGKLDPDGPTVSSEFKSERQLRAELLDMREHGFANPTLYQRLYPKGELRRKSTREAADLLRRHLAIRRELGMNRGTLYYLGRVTDAPVAGRELDQLERDALDLLHLAKDYGFAGIDLYGMDEAREEALRRQRAAWQRVRSVGAGVFAAGAEIHAEDMPDVLVLHGEPAPAKTAQAHALGRRVLAYADPQTGPENPWLFRRNYGVRLWRAGYDGAMLYAYQHSMGSIWNDFDHAVYRDHVLAYPTVDGVIDTLAWEGLREAVDDVRYLSTLLEAIEQARAAPDTAQQAWARRAAAALPGLVRRAQPAAARKQIIELLLARGTAPARAVG